MSDARRDGNRAEPFDLWLRRQLVTTYGPVEQEPLSPELEALLGQARR